VPLALTAAACASRPSPDLRSDSAIHAPPLTPAPPVESREHFRSFDEQEAEIARGPVPGYAGRLAEGPCRLIVLLTDTLAQAAAAESYFTTAPSGRPGCGGSLRFRFQQVRYDFAQLYDWYVGQIRPVFAEPGVSMTDIDERQNRITLGVVDSAAYRRILRIVDTLAVPAAAVHVHVSGRMCIGTGGPSVVVEVRDARGRPAAVGTTIVIQDGAFKDSVDGAHPVDELRVGAGERRPGRYEVRLYKPGYRTIVLRDVMAPGDELCRYAEPSDIRKVTLELLPNAPKVRSIIVLPPGMGFGGAGYSLRLRAVVDADPGISHAVHWRSSDTTVATISSDGLLRTKCRAGTGATVITATSVVDPAVRGHASATVWANRMPARAGVLCS
jgi:hypothetical protein